MSELIHDVISGIISDVEKQKNIEEYLHLIAAETGVQTISGLLEALSVSINKGEQELKEGMVNIMTMHKAKGLSSDVVFIVGAEKQFIPGKNIGIKAEDERRLLYVSLTRARHYLFITYCKKRIKEQRFTGSDSGYPGREITPFLRDSSLKTEFVSDLKEV